MTGINRLAKVLPSISVRFLLDQLLAARKERAQRRITVHYRKGIGAVAGHTCKKWQTGVIVTRAAFRIAQL
jgi:hypothetical protein